MKKLLLTSLLFICCAQANNNLLDPTAPLGENTSDKKKLSFQNITLNAIIISPTSKSAIINSHNVHEGDRIGLSKVLNINAQSVTVESDTGETKVLKLFTQNWLTRSEQAHDK